ncbi:GAF domain-containing protein [Actinopolymorpha cephalotaxi]|uniref:GAF domain-containing protein n=1 Tax=Actinopolymorpha cephalotaxi TaxID=504797 RepID=A0A1I2RGH9_9ACTN|nr:GAF domain-containing protein [Actinopolymorpha cephalotaxi]NYH82233.1 GAF domain-containing protein [Actinopolymorpha cephalotaxi]SFG39774.1 GAF domain-containing protein [Actinopolymorpha cephalotaxi]
MTTGHTRGEGPTRGEGAFPVEFAELTQSLVNDYDPIELLDRVTAMCVDLLPVQAAGVLLADQWGALGTIASSSEQMRLLELMQLQTDHGPCLECYRTGEPINTLDLTGPAARRWPDFAARAVAAGFRGIAAMPMRLRDDLIGALNLLSEQPVPLSHYEQRVAQALADLATIAVVHERTLRRPELPVEQRLAVLNQRVIIEQATGMVAQHGGYDLSEAYGVLRRRARETGRRLTDLATALVEGRITVSEADRPATK